MASMKSLSRIKKQTLDQPLIEILHDEKQIIQKAATGSTEGRSQKELTMHARNAELIIMKLGELKSMAAVPVLKDHLQIAGLKYRASEALAQIGDATTKAEIKEKPTQEKK